METQDELTKATHGFVLVLLGHARDHNIPTPVITKAAPRAVVRMLASFYAEQEGMLDEELERAASDLRLALLEHFATKYPDKVSSEFHRKVGLSAAS